MTAPNVSPDKPSSSGRLKLVLIMLVFLAPIVAAGLLTVSGWQPTGKGNGQPIEPQRSFADVNIELVGGGTYAWRDSEPRLTLVALPGPDCGKQCIAMLELMRNARITLNRNADRLRLLYVGKPPVSQPAVMSDWLVGNDVANKLEAFRPTQPDTVSAVLVESNTTALSYYPSGFDPSGLRKDMQKVIR
ncbi:hypothetical protein EC912_102454 [Luteibacter rhizovicinus]|uniref:Transmembrane protein n=1 Tax=Luteibacter rhizovicinus TaxID=242606 RepID=A0A4R3YSX5_9GAMM|nr:hypothetical protein [Luteibacter rhizovicinus]TCV96105.1 hypothetical protein EC912_102454 [Luteibacter rhizovicinus]